MREEPFLAIAHSNPPPIAPLLLNQYLIANRKAQVLFFLCFEGEPSNGLDILGLSLLAKRLDLVHACTAQ
jgi:hypothetical protein